LYGRPESCEWRPPRFQASRQHHGHPKNGMTVRASLPLLGLMPFRGKVAVVERRKLPSMHAASVEEFAYNFGSCYQRLALGRYRNFHLLPFRPGSRRHHNIAAMVTWNGTVQTALAWALGPTNPRPIPVGAEPFSASVLKEISLEYLLLPPRSALEDRSTQGLPHASTQPPRPSTRCWCCS
jgi:hypothetical protein